MDWPRRYLVHEGPARGVPVFSEEGCTSCGDCARVCPSRSILIPEPSARPVTDSGTCVRCGLCVSVCEEDAVALDGDGTRVAHHRGDLVDDKTFPEAIEVGPPPGRLYRWAIDRSGRDGIRPEDLLKARSRGLDVKGDE